MAWRAVAAVCIAVFVLAIVQSALAGPVHDVQTQLNETGDYSDLEGAGSDYNGNDVITGLFDDWMHMGLIAMFGLMAWGGWRVIRKELTRGGGL